MTDANDAKLEGPIVRLARELREAIDRYDGPRCVRGCDCPMSRAIDAAEQFIACVEGFERGEIVAGGIPG